MAANSNANTQNPVPKTAKGGIAKARGVLGGVAGYGFIGLDAYTRMKDGESMPVAIGKAAVSNALWMAVPGGAATMLGVMALQMAPEIARGLDQVKAGIGAKSRSFGGGFQQSDGQQYMKQMGLNNAMSARQNASSIMANHARGAAKSY
ncbi:hypothetical protein SAMN02799624_05227 [Paenibacillus sp. UNC496MF]|uniref:hypothetical protein n=1 Tax=Paenibacillus sp. UNC496MF TaxID=1502753 RepID=UPI0008E95898|nr:hypothetical protein [Paenibacillus sp. UNC496MF]SFJ62495.1 hypothetical protein SAMN02799624_05227 [Paenibacillus sp. UNC496MF]